MRSAWNWRVLLGAAVLAALLGAANNLVSTHAVPWVGSPEVIPKPLGFDDEPHLAGALKGVKYALRELDKRALPVGVGALVVAALSLLARRRFGLGWSLICERWFALGVAAIFFSACWYKLTNPLEFATAVAQYRMLPPKAVDAFSLWLPALELVVGVGLLSGRWKTEFYALTALLWLMFIAALALALGRRLGITCGCFAIAGVEASVGETWFSLLRDLVLLVPTLWLVWPGSPRRQRGLAGGLDH
jgi:Methylamine utilisation protein MauE